MPAARYWRIIGIETPNSGDLEVADIALYADGIRVDGSATFSSTAAPIAPGKWAAADVRQSGFALVWDFGSEQVVTDAKMVLAATAENVDEYSLQFLGAGGWGTLRRWQGTFPASAPRVQPDVTCDDPHFSKVVLQLPHFGGLSGWQTGFDVSKNLLAGAAYNASVYIDPPWGNKFGDGYFAPNASGTRRSGSLVFTTDGAFLGDFTVEGWFHGVNQVGADVALVALGTSAPTAWWLAFNHAGITYTVKVFNPSGTVVISKTVSSVAYLWRFFSWVRENGTHRLYVGGSLFGSFEDASEIQYDGFLIGKPGTAESTLVMLDGLRITDGVARSPAAPSAPFPMPRFESRVQTVASSPGVALGADVPPYAICTGQSARISPDDGIGWVQGTVKRKGEPRDVPLRRRVRLHDKRDMRLIRETWSDPETGAFRFDGLDPTVPFIAITYDHTGRYCALGDDSIRLEG